MAPSRLRKTFIFPREYSDSVSVSSADELDETEQETLITSLRTHSASSASFYKHAFLPLPLLSTLLYVPTIFSAASSPARAIPLALLSITALCCTAYILHYIPPRSSQSKRDAENGPKGKRPMYQIEAERAARGPVELYLVLLTALLSVLLALEAGLAWRKGHVAEAWRGVLPGAIFGIVMFARTQMAPLDVEGLEGLRYEYKGA